MTQLSFVGSTIRGFTVALSRALASEQLAARSGLLQNIDPRVSLIGFLSLAVAVIVSRRLPVIIALFALSVFIALLSGVQIGPLAKRVWLVVFAFTGLIAVPALFVTPGETLFTFSWAPLSISKPGLRTAAFLVLRAETAVTMMTVLVLCTPWNRLLKALRMLRVPAEIVTMLTMTHRYLFLLIETAQQMFEARQSRTVGHLSGQQQRKLMTSAAGVLLSKSVGLSEEIYMAMISRGFRGEIYLLSELRLRSVDYLAMAGFLAASLSAVWLGR